VLLVCLEVGLRFFGYGSYIIYQPDDELLWVPLPDQRGRTVRGHQPITINADRFRYVRDLESADPTEVRVYTFGDSVTMGWGMDDASHYSAVLEALLSGQDHDRPVRVVSGGVNGYPTTLCVRRFARALRQGQQIDVAILAYSFNSGFEPLTRLQGEERRKFLRKVGIKGVVRRFAIYNFLIEDLLRRAVYYRIRDTLLSGSWKTTSDEVREQRLDDYLRSLELMAETANGHDVKLVFLLLGSKGQRDQLNPHQTAFRKFAIENGIPIVDMVARLDELEHGPLFMDHTHPSVEGHDLIARELVPVVDGVIGPNSLTP
jgi:lysophospholipase L1-like esterase